MSVEKIQAKRIRQIEKDIEQLSREAQARVLRAVHGGLRRDRQAQSHANVLPPTQE